MNIKNIIHVGARPVCAHNKGITLIALVITIIVMLILAAVSITMAINGGLFGYAGNAAKETERARDAELELGNLEDNLTYENLITKYAIVYGDVNLDGKVNGRDVIKLMQYLDSNDTNNKDLNEHALKNADVNNDGSVDETDRKILNYQVGHKEEIPLPYLGELYWETGE